MPVPLVQFRKAGGLGLPIVVVLAAFALASGTVKLPWKTAADEQADPPVKELPGVELVAGKPNSLLVPEAVRRSLGILSGDREQIAARSCRRGLARWRCPARRPWTLPG